jgi:hypothetical protein
MFHLFEHLRLADDPELANLYQRYLRWWARLLAGLILTLGVIW